MKEREIRVVLLDGSEVIMNTGDRVLFQASRPGAIPLSIDADGIIDDVLVALEESQQQVEESKIREIDLEEQYKTLYRMYTDTDKSCGETLDLLKETSRSLVGAQQTIARQREALEFIADMKIIGSAHVSMQAIARGVLKGNFLEGNKEGSDKA